MCKAYQTDLANKNLLIVAVFVLVFFPPYLVNSNYHKMDELSLPKEDSSTWKNNERKKKIYNK